MTDAPELIWPIADPYEPYWLEFAPKNEAHCLGEYIRKDVSDQAIADAYARGVADARKVKPLVWGRDHIRCEWWGNSGLVPAYIVRDDGTWSCDGRSTWYMGHYGGVILAKAAAQADYERRILSALVDPMQTLADLGQEYDDETP